MGKTPVLLCTEAWFVHVCVAAQTNGALACQKGQSRPLYKSAQSTIHQIMRIISSLTLEEAEKKKPRKKKLQLCSPPSMMPKQWGFSAAIRRVKSKPESKFPKEQISACIVANVVPGVWLMQGSLAWDGRTQWVRRLSRQCPLKAHAPIARVWVFPISARGSPFFTKVVPLAQLSRFPFTPKRKEQRVLLSRFSNSCSSAKYCLILTNHITNHISMESLFIQLSDDIHLKIDPYDWFCGPGSHMLTSTLKKKVDKMYIRWIRF